METRNLFFIDARVADYQTLIAGLPANSDWVLLESDQDGIEQIRSALTGYQNLDSIQILSHGAEGTLTESGDMENRRLPTSTPKKNRPRFIRSCK
ncbi:MAG: DUF4347 domain-containing protein [Gammaproteobacteria bacterium]|nr:DUF4347 domain-containing protein [Gammaproteobacteria bacterium]MBU1655218.1 DUF4347 domain-containing protein [Gammaproteobacteria bacterium]MBU1960488.1 DUF4347 domain-containing protein [Gammaproteobacteria bacterium]